MRRVILLSCFCFSILTGPSELFAQFDFAIQAGANIGSMTVKIDNEDTQNLTGHVGIRLGLIAERTINEKMILHTGVIYSQKGGKYSIEDDYSTLSGKTTLNYLDVPLLLKYSMGKGYILGGITLGYGLSGKDVSTKTYDDGDSDTDSYDIEFGSSEDDDFGKLDGGLTVGIGYPIKVKDYNIVLNAYYTYGLIDIAAIEEGNVTTGVIAIGATYFFKGSGQSSTGGGGGKKKEKSTSGEMEYEEEEW